jgi:hypothetical protein
MGRLDGTSGEEVRSREDLNDSRYAIETRRLSREISFRLVTKPLKAGLTGFRDKLDFLWDFPSPHH